VTVRKITVSIDDALLREVEVEAEKAQMSRSQWLAVAVKRALDRQITLAAMDALLAQMERPTRGRKPAVARRDTPKVSGKKASSRRAAP
jgi:predicted transcriptional regulator